VCPRQPQVQHQKGVRSPQSARLRVLGCVATKEVGYFVGYQLLPQAPRRCSGPLLASLRARRLWPAPKEKHRKPQGDVRSRLSCAELSPEASEQHA